MQENNIKDPDRLKLLIKFPTRGRPIEFFKTLNAYYALMKGTNFTVVVTCDANDASMNNANIIKQFKGFKNLTPFFGQNENKIQACNANINPNSFDIVLLASDDMIPQQEGYDMIIKSQMINHYPDMDGCLWFNDGYTTTRINTLCILGSKYYKRFGYIYHPAYKSLWCDNEYTEVAQKLNKITYFPQVIIKHEHPFNNRATRIVYDGTYKTNDVNNAYDQNVYKMRSIDNFDLKIEVK